MLTSVEPKAELIQKQDEVLGHLDVRHPSLWCLPHRVSTACGAVSNSSCLKVNLPVLLLAGHWQLWFLYLLAIWLQLGQVSWTDNTSPYMSFFPPGSQGFHEDTLGYTSDISMYKWLINIWEDQGQNRHQVLSQSPLLSLIPFQRLWAPGAGMEGLGYLSKSYYSQHYLTILRNSCPCYFDLGEGIWRMGEKKNHGKACFPFL